MNKLSLFHDFYNEYFSLNPRTSFSKGWCDEPETADYRAAHRRESVLAVRQKTTDLVEVARAALGIQKKSPSNTIPISAIDEDVPF